MATERKANERKRIGKEAVNEIEATGSEYFIWDDKIPGFGIRVSPAGAGTFIYQYRPGGGRRARTRRLRIGSVTEIAAAQARARAQDHAATVIKGGDPAADRSDLRSAPTFKELAEDFLSHVRARRKQRTAKDYEALLKRMAYPELGSQIGRTVTKGQVSKLHGSFSETPYQANRVLAVISAVYSFAQERGDVPDGYNPARGVERYEERGKERFLSADEYQALGKAIRDLESELDPRVTAALWLLIFTGARLREILNLKWSEVSFGVQI